MKDCVLIKGNGHGLSVFVNESSSYEQIKEDLIAKLESARNFFGANKVTLSFSGKSLASDEQDDLLEVFNEHSDLDILCIMDESDDVKKIRDAISEEVRESVTQSVTKEVESKYREIELKYLDEIDQLKADNKRLEDNIKQIKEEGKRIVSLQQEDKVTFHNSTLRSGQQIVVKHSVVVMGDVNNGARVEADGNVIILGKLKGVVHAGLKGTNNAYVIALDMKPVQLRINEAYGRASDDMMANNKDSEPKIAFVHDNMIAIEKIDNKVLKEIL